MADRIDIKLTGFKDLKKSLSIIRRQEANFKANFKATGDEIAEDMIKDIDNKRVRPKSGKSKLTSSIDVEHQEGRNSISWGVGKISKMDKEVVGQDGKPYWRAVNFGSAHIVGLLLPKGGFTPGDPEPKSTQFRRGRWAPGSDQYHARVTKPIPPMNYIQSAFENMRIKFNNLLRNLR